MKHADNNQFSTPWIIMLFAILIKKWLNLSVVLLKVLLQRNTRKNFYQNLILKYIYFYATLVYMTTSGYEK